MYKRQALGRIASIVESKLGDDDLDAMNEFLLQVGRNVAAAASENTLGMGDKVSKHEGAALKELEVLLLSLIHISEPTRPY